MEVNLVAARANVFFGPTGTIVIADVLAGEDAKMFVMLGGLRYMVRWSQADLYEFMTY